MYYVNNKNTILPQSILYPFKSDVIVLQYKYPEYSGHYLYNNYCNYSEQITRINSII